MKICFDSCEPPISIFGIKDDGGHFLLQVLRKSTMDVKIVQ